MRAIKDLYYIPNNSLLIVAGDVDPAAVFRLAERIFGGWKRGPDRSWRRRYHPSRRSRATSAMSTGGRERRHGWQIQWHGPSVRKDEEATFVADVSATCSTPGVAVPEEAGGQRAWRA